MKETYPKNIVNAVVIVLVAIIIAITFTINYSSSDKSSTHCYKKVYAMELISKTIILINISSNISGD